jgi:hypothetical protein
MSADTMIGKRSDFSVSAHEREIMAEVNAQVPDCKVTMFHRDSPSINYLVFSFGSRRKTFTQPTPFNDIAQIVERASNISRMASRPSRSARYTDDPDDADVSAFAE